MILSTLLTVLLTVSACVTTKPEIKRDVAAVEEKAEGERAEGISPSFLELSIGTLFEWRKTRNYLFTNNLVDTYANTPTGGPQCSPEQEFARSADGRCNSLQFPAMGAAELRFGRNVDLEQTHQPSSASILEPSPREISRKLLTRDEFKPVPFANLLVASWIQFMVHDWFSHGDNESADIANDPFVLDLMPDDDFVTPRSGKLIVPRTKKDSTSRSNFVNAAPTYQNENTHWWDGSQIYGSTQERQNSLRTFENGEMKISADGHLLLDSNGIELTGFNRNWWFGLSMLHNLFVREHNQIAREIAKSHAKDPKFHSRDKTVDDKLYFDQKVFDVARLVNVALMAKIHTIEWTPTILNNKNLRRGMNANWSGVPLIQPALVGGKNELHKNSKGKINPYNITEEFVSVYRMHSLLPESVQIKTRDTGRNIEDIPISNGRDKESSSVTHNTKYDLEDLFYSFGTSHPGLLVLNNFPKFLQNLPMGTIKNVPIGNIDLATIDIIRDRERGVPRYNQFRRSIGLNPFGKISQISDNPETIRKIREVYQKNNDGSLELDETKILERIDLLVGCLAESPRPEGFGFGETTFQIFLLMASRRLEADRFFTSHYKAEVNGIPIYTQEGLDWIKANGMISVLKRNLKLDKQLSGVKNAFAPWDGK